MELKSMAFLAPFLISEFPYQNDFFILNNNETKQNIEFSLHPEGGSTVFNLGGLNYQIKLAITTK